ncbi:MAG TPA: hypothetical protein VGR90_05295, partial [Acidimicrobiales bacterium]|nr:hypothetical protein [Acidimicrobiales bacterium]
MDIERLVAAGVYDPDAPDAAGRLALIRHLADRGVGDEEMVEAHRRGRLVFAASDRLLFPDRDRRTVEGAARDLGVPIEHVARLRMATALPADPEAVVLASFEETLRAFDAAAAIFGEAPTLAFTRVLGASARRVGEAALSLFGAEVAPELSTEVEFAEATEIAQIAAASIPAVFESLLWEHWFQASAGPAPTQSQPDAGNERVTAVAFVDLADSTAWTERLTLRDHAIALGRFDTMAWDLAVASGARVVKMIGDEAMIVAPDASSLVGAATALCAAVHEDADLPDARGAVGFGPVFTRDGDYFGPVVNLASRCVKLADPGSVVVTEETRAALVSSGWTGPIGPRSPAIGPRGDGAGDRVCRGPRRRR